MIEMYLALSPVGRRKEEEEEVVVVVVVVVVEVYHQRCY